MLISSNSRWRRCRLCSRPTNTINSLTSSNTSSIVLSSTRRLSHIIMVRTTTRRRMLTIQKSSTVVTGTRLEESATISLTKREPRTLKRSISPEKKKVRTSTEGGWNHTNRSKWRRTRMAASRTQIVCSRVIAKPAWLKLSSRWLNLLQTTMVLRQMNPLLAQTRLRRSLVPLCQRQNILSQALVRVKISSLTPWTIAQTLTDTSLSPTQVSLLKQARRQSAHVRWNSSN